MDAKDFGQLLKDHPEMLDDPKKFAAILRDIYPSEKGNVNLIITACNAGVVSMLRKSELDSLLTTRIINLLMDDYAIAEEKARWAAELWTDAYYFFRHGELREREQPKAASNAKAEKTPEAAQAKPAEAKKPVPKPAPPVAPVIEMDPSCFEIEETDSGCAITKYVGPKAEQIVIPAYINGKRVTEIRGEHWSAFEGYTNLKSVTILEGITKIGNDAFYKCTSLKSVTMPKGVTEIGERAFKGCTSLTSVTISEGVTKIEQEAFCDCKSLTSVTIPKSVTEFGGGGFHRDPMAREYGNVCDYQSCFA